jgi:hypothetical protein
MLPVPEIGPKNRDAVINSIAQVADLQRVFRNEKCDGWSFKLGGKLLEYRRRRALYTLLTAV